MERIRPIGELISKLKGIEIPWYSVVFEKDTAHLFSGKPLTLFGNIDYYIANNSMVQMNLFDAYGNLVETLSNTIT